MSDRVNGTVKWFNNAKGFGFITRQEGDEDIFVHFRSIQGDGYRTLNEGQTVELTMTQGPKGLQAEDVQKL
jgi:CspA family cold shock protein